MELYEVFEKYLCQRGPRRWEHPLYQLAFPRQSLNTLANCVLGSRRNTQWEAHSSEEDVNVKEMQGCPQTAVLWQAEQGWWEKGPAAL